MEIASSPVQRPDRVTTERPPPAAGGTAAAAFLLSLGLAALMMVAATAAIVLLGHNDRSESALYVGAFAVVLPASLLIAWRLVPSEPAAGALPSLAAVVAVGVTSLLVAVRLVSDLGVSHRALAAAELCAAAALAGLTLLAARGRLAPGALRALGAYVRRPDLAAAGVLALLGALALLFAPGNATTPKLLAGLVFGVVVALTYGRIRPVGLSRPWGLALDLATGALIVLTVVDLTGFSPPGQDLSSSAIVPADTIIGLVQVHQDFYLGPVNDVLHGRALLVDSGSVYGVGSIYTLAAWFKVAPLGYGALGLFGGLLTAAQYVLAWLILRFAGTGRLLAAAALVAAVAATVLAPLGSPAFFLNVGGLRFGLPYLLIALSVRACARAGDRTALSGGVLATIAAISLWSAETFVYAAAAFVAVAVWDAAIRSTSVRAGARTLLGGLGRGAAACVAAHILFAVVTRVLAGDWPDWGWYIAYVREWVGAYEKELFSAWSPGWLLGGVYFASFAGLATLLVSMREYAERNRVALLAVASTAAMGAANLSYFVAHSADPILPFIALPAIIVVTIWLSLALRAEFLAGPVRVAAVGFCAWLFALTVLGGWHDVRHRWPRTALAHALPGGHSFSGDLDRAWESRPIDPRVGAAERMIDRYFPPGGKALVLVEMDLGTEALVRSGRVNVLPISHPWQEQVAPQYSTPRMAAAIAALRPGTPMLFQRRPGQRTGYTLKVLQSFGAIEVGQRLGPQQLVALRMIRRRFVLRRVARGPDRLEVVRLEPRR